MQERIFIVIGLVADCSHRDSSPFGSQVTLTPKRVIGSEQQPGCSEAPLTWIFAMAQFWHVSCSYRQADSRR